MRNAFFTGYESIGEWPHERGMFNSVCIALTTLNVINSITHIIYKYSFKSKKRVLYLLVFNKYFIYAFIFNVLTKEGVPPALVGSVADISQTL